MEGYDKEKAARVWQRVQGSVAEDPTRGLTGMIAEEWADAADCAITTLIRADRPS